MGLLAPLASLLGIEVDVLMTRLKESAVAFAAIGLFLVIALAFLLVALYTALSSWLGPMWAPLAIAGGALIIALVLYLALRMQIAAQKRRDEERRSETTALIASAALAALPELLKSPFMRNVGIPLGLYVGFLVMSRSRKSTDDVPPDPE